MRYGAAAVHLECCFEQCYLVRQILMVALATAHAARASVPKFWPEKDSYVTVCTFYSSPFLCGDEMRVWHSSFLAFSRYRSSLPVWEERRVLKHLFLNKERV